MRSHVRFLPPAAVAVVLLVGADLVLARSAGAGPPSTAQDVNVVSPLTNNGSVPVEATIKGIVKTRVNPALTHVGALASDVVTLVGGSSGITQILHSDGSISTFTSVPSGKALVITDFEWVEGTEPGASAVFQLFRTPASGPGQFLVYEDFDTADANGWAKGKTSMTTGIAFGPGTGLYFFTAGSVFAHGYYVDVP